MECGVGDLRAENQHDLDVIADIVATSWRAGTQIPSLYESAPNLAVADAYRIAASVRDLNQEIGMTIAGRKIGFTNRAAWSQYDPMWGYVYDSTVSSIDDLSNGLSVRNLAEPRIEPEIVFKLGQTPQPAMSASQLYSCIEWVACGFEIVHSIYPDWKFTDIDAIAAGGLHGRLAIGRPTAIDLISADNLSHFTCDLSCDGTLVHQGYSEIVMGSPLKALAFIVDLVATLDGHEQLTAGEIITTGSLTAVPSIAAGQTWSMDLQGVPLESISLLFTE